MVSRSKLTLVPWGAPEKVRLTGFWKSPDTIVLRVDVPELPRKTVSIAGLSSKFENGVPAGGLPELTLPPPQADMSSRAAQARSGKNIDKVRLNCAIHTPVPLTGYGLTAVIAGARCCGNRGKGLRLLAATETCQNSIRTLGTAIWGNPLFTIPGHTLGSMTHERSVAWLCPGLVSSHSYDHRAAVGGKPVPCPASRS